MMTFADNAEYSWQTAPAQVHCSSLEDRTMDQHLKSRLAELRNMPSEDAADWLITNCPVDSETGEAFLLIPRLSWKKRDQRKLAEHYLRKIPYASQRPYEVFASIMQIPGFVDVVEKFLPTREADKKLLRYHLSPVLRKSVRSDADRAAVDALMKKI
jgi:hypothetical protein